MHGLREAPAGVRRAGRPSPAFSSSSSCCCSPPRRRPTAPGQLIYAKRIGTSTSEAGAWAMAARAERGDGDRRLEDRAGLPARCRWWPGTPPAARSGSRTYASPGYAHAVAFDRAGNVYVAATIDPSAGGDIAVIKYSAAGTWKWTQTYDARRSATPLGRSPSTGPATWSSPAPASPPAPRWGSSC